MKPSFLIASASSGSGKTTFSLGIMRALRRRGLSVQPFKCGPDYIDTQFQTLAASRESVNLDLFMSSPEHAGGLFSHFSDNAGANVIEGAMGMFDGFNGWEGSAARIAITIGLPVILVVDASSTAYSVAATIYGFTHFKKDIKVVGVVFNRVASESHFSFLKKACADVNVSCFGYIKKSSDLIIPSRHLGLTLTSQDEMERFIDMAADEVERHVDIDAILHATSTQPKRCSLDIPRLTATKVAVAADEAFNFIYKANIIALGGDVRYFSPINDIRLPDADLLYLPGGYPELYADKLAANTSMRASVRDFVESGRKVIAECGGFIYLTEEIDGNPMCGVFPLKTTMRESRLKLGYREVDFGNMVLRGHEFHYSRVEPSGSRPVTTTAFPQKNAKGIPVESLTYRYKNAIAGYTHLYWAEHGISDIFKS